MEERNRDIGAPINLPSESLLYTVRKLLLGFIFYSSKGHPAAIAEFIQARGLD